MHWLRIFREDPYCSQSQCSGNENQDANSTNEAIRQQPSARTRASIMWNPNYDVTNNHEVGGSAITIIAKDSSEFDP